jgi:hypothetical protein
MHLLTYSWISPLDGKLRQHSVVSRNWPETLARKYEAHGKADLAVVYLVELPPLTQQRVIELKAAGVEVEE